MAVVNLVKTLRGKTGWVSLSADKKKVIAEGKTLKEVVEKLKKMGNPKGFMMPITKDFSSYVG